MGQTVRDLRDLPLLYVSEEEKNMGAPKKTRAELLDKIIQFIYDYQQKHNGETPALNVVEKHVGIPAAGGYYIAILVDDGRLDRIGVRPFRVTINENHRLNERAIKAWKRIQERIERSDAAERDRIRTEQGENQEIAQRETDHAAALSLVGRPHMSDTVVAELRPAQTDVRPMTTTAPRDYRDHPEDWRQPAPQTQDLDATKVTRFNEAQARVREVNREVRTMMPKLLKITDDRDLVFELLSRGYRVDKVR